MVSAHNKAILDFERTWFLLPGPKDQAIREHLGISATRYYQILRRLVEDPEAMAYDPLTIRRLRRVQASDARKRRDDCQEVDR